MSLDRFTLPREDPWEVISDPDGWFAYHRGHRYQGPFESEEETEEWICQNEEDHQ